MSQFSRIALTSSNMLSMVQKFHTRTAHLNREKLCLAKLELLGPSMINPEILCSGFRNFEMQMQKVIVA